MSWMHHFVKMQLEKKYAIFTRNSFILSVNQIHGKLLWWMLVIKNVPNVKFNEVSSNWKERFIPTVCEIVRKKIFALLFRVVINFNNYLKFDARKAPRFRQGILESNLQSIKVKLIENYQKYTLTRSWPRILTTVCHF